MASRYRVTVSGQQHWPAWATEPVDLVDADPAWTVQGEQERDHLETLLAPWLIAHIESHVETRNTASRSYWTPPACASSGLML